MVAHESMVQAAISQYHSDEVFRRFVDGILAGIMVKKGVTWSAEQLMVQATPTGVPAAILIYKRYRASQII